MNAPVRILLVEDNRGDVILTRRAFKDAKIANELSVADSGEMALAMLKREEEYQNLALPDLILLDLNLPKMKGTDVLEVLKNDPLLRRIPVIVLSSSKAQQDIVRCYDLYTNAYVAKPANLESYSDAVSKIEQFWFMLALSCGEAKEV